MAAPTDSPTRFRGQPWSNWTDFLGRESPISDEEDPDKPQPGCMRLSKEDMGLFGLCPETDGFYAVICEICEACVKPQGLINHMELWHKPDTTDALPPPEPPEKISNSKSGTSKGSGSNRIDVGNGKLKVKKPQTAPCNKLVRGSSSAKEQSASLDLEKIPLPPVEASVASATLLQPVVALTPLGSPSQVPSAPASPSPSKKRPKIERLKEREYDPDKHCGVWNGENSKPCTRSLTCRSHSQSMKKAVPGRSKHFEKLLADHRAAKDAAIKLVPTLSQPSPQETETNQAMSPPPPGSVQLDIPASPISSSVVAPNSTPVANCAPHPSASATPPLPSLPDLTKDTFDGHVVPDATCILIPTPLAISIPNPMLTAIPTTSLVPPPTHSFAAVEMCDFPTLFEDVTWLKTHPRPLAVCSFSGRKVGTLICNTRRLDVVREGLREALAHGPIRSSLNNDLYGNTSTNHATGTIKTVLSNICANGQFHVPNILGGSLKRHADSSKSSGNTKSKRAKRKHAQNMNPAELIGSLFTRKNNRIGGRGNHVPLVTVAIANGSTSSQGETSETKTRADHPKAIADSAGAKVLKMHHIQSWFNRSRVQEAREPPRGPPWTTP